MNNNYEYEVIDLDEVLEVNAEENKGFRNKLKNARQKLGHFLYDNKEVIAVGTTVAVAGIGISKAVKKRKAYNEDEEYNKTTRNLNDAINYGLDGGVLDSEYDEYYDMQRMNDVGLTARVVKSELKDVINDIEIIKQKIMELK